MGETDLRRGARWLGVAAAALGLAAATALADPPTGAITVQPNIPNQGAPATLTCQPCPGVDTFEWDLEPDAPGFERTGRSVTWTFEDAGEHTVNLRLTRDGEVATITKTVAVNAPPTVTFDFDPDSPLAGQDVDFQGLVTDPEGNGIVSRTWTFGDGEAGSGLAPSHSYDAPGTYTVTLSATDSNGATGTATQSIVVRSDAGPTSSFAVAPPVPDVGEAVSFTSTSQASQGAITDIDWDFDGNDDFADFTGSPAFWTFDTPGTHVVKLRATQTNGLTAVGQTSLRVNGLPTADFTWNPASPVAGDSVDLISTSTDFEGQLATLSWDLDGDGRFGDGSQPQIRQPFPEAGAYDIGLRVTDSDGRVNTVRKDVVVSEFPPPSSEPTGGTEPGGGPSQRSPTPRPRFMSPFPVVRIAGTVMPNGALIKVLSVRGPRGSRIRVRCLGRGCPVGSMTRTSARRLVRLHKFERRLRAGIRIKLFVRQENRIGKYTSFLIRAGAPPKRVDLCLFPARRSPGRCP